MKGIISLNNFSFRYSDKYILKNINIEIEEGQCVGILGKNGSGKTTLINCIIGELRGEGNISVLNTIPNIHSIEFKSNIGIVLDNDILIDYLTLNEYLNFIGQLFKLEKVQIEKSIKYWLKYFDLEEQRYRIIKFFSHGMRKKVQIIAALMHNPKIIIVDEPTNGLDIEMIYLFKNVILDLKKKGITIVISTHILSFVEDVCDEVIIINDGVINNIFSISSINEQKLENIFIEQINRDGD
ncbi:ABC transporter ATP-binding protein [Clostridium algidicarnis]|uniref:ABC transporter ATP-binding protein n=1 Tax=Clostridium algidicarnis TaxID=37659 RepID=A0ABS6C6L1_9CLOT|nr:ABC transporter ATP-binding protein [Clostridium algidicarnis]MBU3194917.1 ABC transporter ATP-binding protein [Clostridium algidicarnis]MBU3221126.1 ABC transporter ATP-binding protein [Clostridium algidicarnis]MCB2286835.1 ABC transporter ATP-binding protein [Clostridium algidicarnis]